MVRTKLLELCLEHVGIAREPLCLGWTMVGHLGVSAGAKVAVQIRKVAARELELLRRRGWVAALRRRVAN